MRVYVGAGEAARYENYRRALERLGAQVCFNGGGADCDALLLPGGGDLEPWRYGQENTASTGLEPLRDAGELELLERFCGAGKPVLGICRGLQVINVFFGGTLIQHIEGHGQSGGADRLHGVRTAAGVLREVCGERLIVNSAHHQAVERTGSGLEPVQWTPDGCIEALCHRSLPVWAVQWHPERLTGGAGDRFLSAFLAWNGKK